MLRFHAMSTVIPLSNALRYSLVQRIRMFVRLSMARGVALQVFFAEVSLG